MTIVMKDTPSALSPVAATESPLCTAVYGGCGADKLELARLEACGIGARVHPSLRPEWLEILREGLRHEPYYIVATLEGRSRGVLPLAFVKSRLFGRFLVGLPYLNLGGVHADEPSTAAALIDRAVELADRLDVRYLELRHERRWEHPALTHEITSKVHMRLALPPTAGELWDSLSSKVRSQVRKATKNGVSVHWGRDEFVGRFYEVFSRNMRDLGTPVYPRRMFEKMVEVFQGDAEICVTEYQDQTVAAGILVHGHGIGDVPSASSLRSLNRLNGNMLLYWHLLSRAIERGQQIFDFGRCSLESPTYKFKRQWGAEPHPAVWQYYVRHGDPQAMRPDASKNQRRIAIWRRLPVWLTRLIGPPIVRGIP